MIDRHLTHKCKIVCGPFGPHAGKIHCEDCNKHVQWLSRKQLTRALLSKNLTGEIKWTQIPEKTV